MAEDALYQQAIIDHAKMAVGAGRLDRPTASATVDNPLCGDRVTVDLVLQHGVVAAIGHQVRGCLLCNAASSVLARRGIGRDGAALRAVATEFDAMIREDGPAPDDWPDLACFRPVHAAKSRHECVLLPFRAAVKALEALDGE